MDSLVDYSSMESVIIALSRRNIPIPEDEAIARKIAYKALLEMDVMMAHSLRLSRYYRDFTADQWREVIAISGEEAVRNHVRALRFCTEQGVIINPIVHLEVPEVPAEILN